MWYRLSKDQKKAYKPVLRGLFTDRTKGFSADDEAELQISNPELDLQSPEPEEPIDAPVENIPGAIPEINTPEVDQAPILVDTQEPPVQSDDLAKPNPIVPVAPHDNCNCANNIETMPSGKMIWKITESMCDICKRAAENFNYQQNILFPDPEIFI